MAEGLDVLLLDGGAIRRESLGNDEQHFSRLVVQLVAGEENAAAKGSAKHLEDGVMIIK